MINDLIDLLPDTVLHARPSTDNGYGWPGHDRYGQPVYEAPTEHPARVVYRQRLVRTPRGDKAIARGECWLPGDPGITVDSRLTLPDGSCPAILAVERLADDQGSWHTKVFFG